MLDNTTLLKQTLQANGSRYTAARETTYKLLLSPWPQSITEVLAKAKGHIDRVSVYRNIELFEKLGIVHRIYVGWKYKLELSDKFMAHHHHLSCINCGKIFDIKDEKHIDTFIAQISAQFAFQPRGHQFEIDGYCQDCQHEVDRTVV